MPLILFLFGDWVGIMIDSMWLGSLFCFLFFFNRNACKQALEERQSFPTWTKEINFELLEENNKIDKRERIYLM